MRHDIKNILPDEEIDILYSSKQDWFDVVDGEQNWDNSYNKIIIFWRVLRKIIAHDVKNNSYINLDYISFPEFEEMAVSRGSHLNDNNFFFKIDEHTFEHDISFIKATFYGNANLSAIIFKEKAIFDNAQFKNGANFNKSEFYGEVSFKNSNFNEDSYFKFSKFHKISDFNRAHFKKKISFRNSIFYAQASFRRMVCDMDLYFLASSFKTKVDFWGTICQGKAEFTSAKFNQEAFFWDINFSGVSNYNNAVFSDKVSFKNSKFEDVSFAFATFKQEADFSYTAFIKGSFVESSFFILNFYQSVFKNATLNNLYGFKGLKSVALNSSHIANKETARIIKNFSIKTNNISDINKFYAIELDKIGKSLLTKESYNIKDWLILKAYKFTSNYSQNYILPLIWLMIITFIFTCAYPGTSNTDIFIHLLNPFELFSVYNLHEDYYTQTFISRIISLYFIYHFIISIKTKVGKR